MYSKETLKKVMEKSAALKNHYAAMDPAKIALCISTGNKKIGRVMNVSLMPIMTCANCSGCSKLCYDIKACLQYVNVIDARVRNTVLLELDRDRYFELIEKKISRRRKNKYFRWHVAGDIIDIDYFSRMCEIAARHPDFVFWTYTKNYSIVNEYCKRYGKDFIPENLHIMFSEWRGMAMNNPYNFPEFKVVFKDEIPPRGFYCPGNCDTCKANKTGCLVGMTTYCMEH